MDCGCAYNATESVGRLQRLVKPIIVVDRHGAPQRGGAFPRHAV